MEVDDRTRIGSGLLVLTGFGFGAAFGLLVRGGAQWGTVGEWVGGAGALFAALVALHLGRVTFERQSSREAERAAIAAVRLASALVSVAADVEQIGEAAREAEQGERVKMYRVLASGLHFSRSLGALHNLRAESTQLATASAVELEALLESGDRLARGMEFLESLSVHKHGDAATRILDALLERGDEFVGDARSFADELYNLAAPFSPRLAHRNEKGHPKVA